MHLHFYTAWENVEKLEKGEIIQVWNKTQAREADVHVSLDTDDFVVTRTPMKDVFEVMTTVNWKV